MATQKRVLVWSTPRSLSTVLMRALSQLPDSLVIHEYLLLVGKNEEPDILGDQKAKMQNWDSEPSFNILKWKEMYEEPYHDKSFVFGKEIASSLGRKVEMIPDGYTHVFLMHNPFKSIPSNEKSLSFFPRDLRFSVMLKPNQFEALAHIYDYVTTTLGQSKPVVLDASDLLANPAKTLQLFCKATGLPFSQKLLRWEQVKERPPSNLLLPTFMWDNGKAFGVFKTAFESTCFHKETTGVAKETDPISPEIEQLIQDALPYYEKLYKYRLETV
ncbi:branched-chain-amino-acid aminotransferase-like protein 2 [Acanthaster planci]|uniref:Branched-chain-amino-acid aminotransferase-like protein 2 n=1 Tax=Acanthaster planci TaxID=133434 RepID=A0A8B7XK31_ACAPL|nr:branched-chain-amino-acid aminotransferase-like protein 2 [Acanthaster planci]